MSSNANLLADNTGVPGNLVVKQLPRLDPSHTTGRHDSKALEVTSLKQYGESVMLLDNEV